MHTSQKERCIFVKNDVRTVRDPVVVPLYVYIHISQRCLQFWH